MSETFLDIVIPQRWITEPVLCCNKANIKGLKEINYSYQKLYRAKRSFTKKSRIIRNVREIDYWKACDLYYVFIFWLQFAIKRRYSE